MKLISTTGTCVRWSDNGIVEVAVFDEDMGWEDRHWFMVGSEVPITEGDLLERIGDAEGQVWPVGR